MKHVPVPVFLAERGRRAALRLGDGNVLRWFWPQAGVGEQRRRDGGAGVMGSDELFGGRCEEGLAKFSLPNVGAV
ncbi:MAG: hypothetical protein WA771_00300 [Chthoniobacterales bacterium]